MKNSWLWKFSVGTLRETLRSLLILKQKERRDAQKQPRAKNTLVLLTSRALCYVTRQKTRAIFPDVLNLEGAKRARDQVEKIVSPGGGRRGYAGRGMRDVGHRSLQGEGKEGEESSRRAQRTYILPSQQQQQRRRSDRTGPETRHGGAREGPRAPRDRGVAGPVSGPAVCSPQSLADAWTSWSVEC